MAKFKEYNLNISSKNKKIVEKYLEKIKKFIEKNSLEKELFSDLEERFFEKLSNLKEINELEIKKIINEIGEPEDIFEVENETVSEEFQKNYNLFQKYHGDLIFFWLALFFIASMFGVNIFFALFLILFFSFIIYLFADSKRKSLVNFFKFISSSIKKTFFLCLNFVKYIFKNICPVIRVLFFGGFGVFLAILSVGLLFLAGAYYSKFELYQVEIFSDVSPYFIVGIAFGIFALVVFCIYSISYAFRKKGFGNFLIILASFSLFVAIFFASVVGFDLAKKYSNIEDHKQVYEFSLKDKNIKKLDINRNYFLDFPFLSDSWQYDLKVSKDDKIRIIQKSRILTARDNISKIKNALNPIVFDLQGNDLFLKYKDGKLFSGRLPFFLKENYSVEIQVPKNLIYQFQGFGFQNSLKIPAKYKKYEPFLRIESCREYFYDEKLGDFTCNVSPEKLQDAKNQTLSLELIKSISEFSTIKHKVEYKRNYYSDICQNYRIYDDCNLDWQIFDKDIKISENHIKFIYSDQSLIIKAEIDFKETKDLDFEFSNFKINEVEINHQNFNTKYYEKAGLENIFKNTDSEVLNLLKEKSLIESISEISPIKHKKSFKKPYAYSNRNYFSIDGDVILSKERNTIFSDWLIETDTIRFRENEVEFTYSDKTLEIKAQAKLTQNSKVFQYNFSDFKIIDIRVNHYNFKNEYYTKDSLKYFFNTGVEKR